MGREKFDKTYKRGSKGGEAKVVKKYSPTTFEALRDYYLGKKSGK